MISILFAICSNLNRKIIVKSHYLLNIRFQNLTKKKLNSERKISDETFLKKQKTN